MDDKTLYVMLLIPAAFVLCNFFVKSWALSAVIVILSVGIIVVSATQFFNVWVCLAAAVIAIGGIIGAFLRRPGGVM